MRPRLTFLPVAGLGNRIRALDAAVRLAAPCGAKLRVFWFRDRECPCHFHSLFMENEQNPLSSLLADWECIEASSTRHFCHSRPCRVNAYLPLWPQLLMFRRRMYENAVPRRMAASFDFAAWLREGGDCLLTTYDAFMGWPKGKMLPWFVPSEKVQMLMKPLSDEFYGRMVGLHIRRADNDRSIRTSPTELFHRRVNELIDENPATRFFLATDSPAERDALVRAFGKMRFVVPDYAPSRRTEDDILRAAAEMYLLARCDFVVGSYWSSFSKVAAALGGKKFELLRKG